MKTPLWVPGPERVATANLTRFMGFVAARHGRSFADVRELHEWSVAAIPEFWAAVWDFVGIQASRPYREVVDDLERFPGARWFGGARLNFAENLLRHGDDRLALVARGEAGERRSLTYAELRAAVARLAAGLRSLGLGPGDRVAAYLPNLIETSVAMLAAASIGAVWSSCGVELGAAAAVDRLGQLEPKLLFAADAYRYKGRTSDLREQVGRMAAAIPSLERIVVVPGAGGPSDPGGIPRAVPYGELAEGGQTPPLAFAQLPADHPLYVMFSSGTTGKPKCLVQSAGGVLVNHLKELVLHTDLRREDTLFYITTCSWMMWNWLQSALAVGATLLLYDGCPTYPDAGALWRLAEEERLTVFGLSASYLNLLRREGRQPGREADLSTLRAISQTGSVLSAEGFRYVYRAIKPDLHFNSISGGTDINGCFAIGSPVQPVFAGELQGPALGMKIKAYDGHGRAVWDRQGELVCEAPAPSMPLGFWNDPGGERYRAAYFQHYPRVWRHGDYVTMHRDTGGVTFHGRSDAVLKPGGVRIGTAEIYNVVEALPEVADSLAVGQRWAGDQRIVLFVKLAAGSALTDALRRRIRTALREHASPRHVPAVILEMPDAPYTLNMKKVEGAVADLLHGRRVSNRDALANPEVLEYFERIAADLAPAEQGG
jgi:acetoacetyl-CoA synthetase